MPNLFNTMVIKPEDSDFDQKIESYISSPKYINLFVLGQEQLSREIVDLADSLADQNLGTKGFTRKVIWIQDNEKIDYYLINLLKTYSNFNEIDFNDVLLFVTCPRSRVVKDIYYNNHNKNLNPAVIEKFFVNALKNIE